MKLPLATVWNGCLRSVGR